MRRRPLLAVVSVVAMLLASMWIATGPVLAAPCDGSTTSLQNGDFELPPVAANTFTLFPAGSVPPWLTTDVADEIEIWGTGFNGVPAAQGNAFAELNANSAGTLYQDIVTNPGDTLTWTLQHRGRAGDDSMQVQIGDAFAVDVTANTGWNYVSPDLTDGTAAWGTHTDTYVVPAGQVCTRFAFRAVSTASGSPSVGNFLDDVSFSISSPASTPVPTGAPGAGGAGTTPPPTSTFPNVEPGDEPVWLVPLAAAGFAIVFGAWFLGRPGRRRR